MPRVVAMIVNWNAADLAVECLSSLVRCGFDNNGLVAVYVVDNASPDGSAAKLESVIRDRGWAPWARLIRAPENGGFASGNNIAIRAALADDPHITHLWLLNPDTLVRPGAMETLLHFMRTHPQVGIAGGRSEDPDGTPQLCCFRFPTLVSEFAYYLRLGIVDRLLGRWISRVGVPEEPCPIDWVSGAHMMIRREVIDAIGRLDEGYFLYYEETDFTLRARRAGWTCWHVPQSRVVHLVGQSSGVTLRDGKPRRLPTYWFESRRRYFVLNHGRAYAIATDLAVIAAHLLWRARRWLQRKPDTDPPRFLADFLRHSALFNGRNTLAPRRIDP